jgi:anti-sigma factor RsiW
MTDCTNADVRDLLPGYAHGTLGAAERARVESHLAGCADCAAELSLIRAARRALAPAPAVDVARIVAALPMAPARPAAGAEPGVTPLAARRTERRRRARAGWRQAAAIAAVAVGAVGLSLAGRAARIERLPTGARGAATVVGAARPGDGRTGLASAALPPQPVENDTSGRPAEGSTLPVGGALSELTDAALVSLLGDIDAFDDAPSAEPAAVIPTMLDEEVGS